MPRPEKVVVQPAGRAGATTPSKFCTRDVRRAARNEGVDKRAVVRRSILHLQRSVHGAAAGQSRINRKGEIAEDCRSATGTNGAVVLPRWRTGHATPRLERPGQCGCRADDTWPSRVNDAEGDGNDFTRIKDAIRAGRDNRGTALANRVCRDGREFETADAGAPIEGPVGGIVLLGIPEGLVVDRIEVKAL